MIFKYFTISPLELSVSPEEALDILKTTIDEPKQQIKDLNSRSQTALDMLQVCM